MAADATAVRASGRRCAVPEDRCALEPHPAASTTTAIAVTPAARMRLTVPVGPGRRSRPLVTSPPAWRATGRTSSSSTDKPPADGGESGTAEEPGKRRGGRFARLRESLRKTRQALQSEIQATLFEDLSDETWERLEEALIYADVGASTTAKVVAQLEQEATENKLTGGQELSDRLVELLTEIAKTGDDRIDLRAEPTVILVAGVNGTGKTTTLGKLAWHLSKELNRSVVLAAGDTFRAAAVEQLEIWAQRAGGRLRQGRPRRRFGLGRVRRDRPGAPPGRRRGPDRHRRAPAHPGQPDERADEGQAGDRQADPRGAA